MKKEMFGIAVLMILLMVSMVVAFDTEITISTSPSQRVHIRVISPVDGTTLQNGFFNKVADDNGEILISYSSNRANIDMSTYLKDVENSFNKYENLATGGSIYIDLNQENPVPIIEGIEEAVNETDNEINSSELEVVVEIEDEEVIEESEVIEETKESGKITGFVVDTGKDIVTSKITYFVLGGILIALVVIFVAKKKWKFKKGTYIDFKVKDNKVDDLKDKIEDKGDRLADAEKKLDEAKEELDEIKNRKGKLEEAKKKFEQDKKELERLEKED